MFGIIHLKNITDGKKIQAGFKMRGVIYFLSETYLTV
jgi:hypothetical protein